MNGWKPHGYNSVSPYLICENAAKVIDFIERGLGGEQLRRFDHPDGSIMHVEIRIDDTVVMIGGGATGMGATHAQIHMYVRDVDAVFARALEAGAISVQEPTRKRSDDDRRGGVRDSSGTTWWIATQ
jgi:uncharacterized glyoxalase superfamily protein PhnB